MLFGLFSFTMFLRVSNMSTDKILSSENASQQLFKDGHIDFVFELSYDSWWKQQITETLKAVLGKF